MNIPTTQFNEAFKKLPPVIKEYIAYDELATVTGAVGAKYGLHVDTIGALYRETTNMLLGFENPTQFISELKSVGVPESSIAPIVQEMNERVFMPIHKKMQEPISEDDSDEESDGSEENGDDSINQDVMAPVANTVAAVPQTPAPVFTQTPAYMPPPVVPPPAMPPVPPSVSQYAGNAAFPATAVPQPQAAYVPPVAPMPQPSVSSFPQPAAAPVAPASTVNTQVYTPAPTQAPQPAPQSSNRDALHDILKQYGVDPYRESID